LGIDLVGPDDPGTGVTRNDSGDYGPNALLSHPEILSARSRPGSRTVVRFRVDASSSNNYRIEFFASPIPDPTGFGEGMSYLGVFETAVEYNRNTFAATVADVPIGTYITATLTDTGSRITSEFSQAVPVTELQP